MVKSAAAGRGTDLSKATASYRVAPAKIAAAQKILGTATAVETIEAALALVVLQEELISGSGVLAGVQICSPDP